MGINEILIWYFTVTLFGFLVLPLVFHLFQNLPDRGITLMKPFGLLIIGYIYWLLGSLNLIPNNNSGLLLSGAILICLEMLIIKREELLSLKTWLATQYRLLLFSELLFFLAFSGWAIIRAYNPNIEGTEKPMEYMMINSILKSPSFPLRDAWLSDHAISYYNFGYLIIAILARITNTQPQIAFNLGLALFFALTASGATGVLLNMIALVKSERANCDKKPKPELISSFWPALLAPLMILIVGNFYGALEFIHDNNFAKDLKIPAIYYDFGYAPDINNVHSLNDFERKPGIFSGNINIWEWIDLKQLGPQTTFSSSDHVQWDLPNWFFAARVVHDRNLIGQETEAIDEVPAFSFLLGDMHPHVMALPFGILAVALAFEWMITGRKEANYWLDRHKVHEFFSYGIKFIFSAIILGGLLISNTWDFPIYWFLIVICWAVGIVSIIGIERLIQNWVLVIKFALLLLGSCLLLYFPFFFTFQSQAGGILSNWVYPTRFQQTFVMFGPVLIPISIFIIWFSRRVRRHLQFQTLLQTTLFILIVLLLISILLGIIKFSDLGFSFEPLIFSQVLQLLLQRRLVDCLTTVVAALLIGAAFSIIIGVIQFSPKNTNNSEEFQISQEDRPEMFSVWLCLLLILTGALLLIGPEFVYLKDNFGTRMNTVFKFYFQIWLLWGLAAAFSIWYIYSHSRNGLRGLFVIGISINLIIGSYYLLGGLVNKTSNFSGTPTLDGMAYFAQSYPDDWAAIQWLNENAKADSVILEGSRGAYWIEGRSSRFSMATGLPTVMGWGNHEAQWRGEYYTKVMGRLEDIKTIYQVRDWKTTEELLHKYKIRYVIVSPLEIEWYRLVYINKFDQNTKKIFEKGDVRIYQITG